MYRLWKTAFAKYGNLGGAWLIGQQQLKYGMGLPTVTRRPTKQTAADNNTLREGEGQLVM